MPYNYGVVVFKKEGVCTTDDCLVSKYPQTLCFSVSSENLITRVRSLVFRSMLRQEIGWFDDERHSTGTLTSLLDDDSRQLQGVKYLLFSSCFVLFFLSQ